MTVLTASPSTLEAGPIDTSTWTPYLSEQYGFRLMHPPGWTVTPAERDWTLETDAAQQGSGGRELFVSPAGDLYVAVWSAPATDTPETLNGVAAWVEDFCRLRGASCTGLDQSVPLCNESRDCHPGLLVTVDGSFAEAYFTGGNHHGRMIGVEVGLPEWHENVAKYGGSRRLLEGFLSTMDVCPARPPAQPGQMSSGCPR